MRRVKERDEKKEKVEEKAPRKFFTDDGKLNKLVKFGVECCEMI